MGRGRYLKIAMVVQIFMVLNVRIFYCFQSQQDRVHQGQISDAGVRPSDALSWGWQRNSKRPQQGEKLDKLDYLYIKSIHSNKSSCVI